MERMNCFPCHGTMTISAVWCVVSCSWSWLLLLLSARRLLERVHTIGRSIRESPGRTCQVSVQQGGERCALLRASFARTHAAHRVLVL